MEDLTRLRARVYERNKHDAGWGTHDAVARSYVAGHACALSIPSVPRAMRLSRVGPCGDGSGDESGGGYGNGPCARGEGDACGYGDGVGNGYGGGGGDGWGDSGHGRGTGDGDDSGNKRWFVYETRYDALWKV